MDLWGVATDLGLEVREHRGPHRSGYAAGERMILVRPGMRGRVLRSILAHEIGHHVLGHRPTEFGPLRARQEADANRWAASALIDAGAYREVEQHRDGHVPSMAFDLNVSEELVVIYRSRLLRTDTAVYVAPRHGVGQWGHRFEVA